MMRRTTTYVLILMAALLYSAPALGQGSPGKPPSATGVLLLAHGGSAPWNENVLALAARVNRDRPVEVAFGMAQRAAIQTAVDALVRRGVGEIVAVPLFVSSHSSVVTSTEYLLGLRAEAPPEVAVFAKMAHGHGKAHTADNHAAHTESAADATRPVVCRVPIRMTRALDSHPIVAAILTDRVRTMSSDPSREAVILVAHGPVGDSENQQWLAAMGVLAASIRQTAAYASIDALTVRDDAPAPIKAAATAELRALVEQRQRSGARVLIVPVLLSFGGIEQGIRKRLEGLEYVMASQAIMPDDRLADWIESALR